MELLLTIIVAFIIFGWIFRMLFPLLLAWYVKRKMNRGSGGFGGFTGGVYGDMFNAGSKRAEQYEKKEGQVTVETLEEREKVIEDNVGEYIDFEEDK